MTTALFDIPEDVTAGMALLDHADPAWWRSGVPNAIDLTRLDMTDGRWDILGQRCPPVRLTQLLGPSAREDDRSFAQAMHLSGIRDHFTVTQWMRTHGFTPPGCGPATVAMSRAGWAALIAARRGGYCRIARLESAGAQVLVKAN